LRQLQTNVQGSRRRSFQIHKTRDEIRDGDAMNELQTACDYIAESIARSLCECRGRLLLTGLSPDELLQGAMEVFVKKIPGFADMPEARMQDFADRLGVALCNQMLIEHDILLMQHRGMRAQ